MSETKTFINNKGYFQLYFFNNTDVIFLHVFYVSYFHYIIYMIILVEISSQWFDILAQLLLDFTYYLIGECIGQQEFPCCLEQFHG